MPRMMVDGLDMTGKKPMKGSDWISYKQTLCDLKEGGQSNKDLQKFLYDDGFGARIKLINKKLNQWDNHTYKTNPRLLEELKNAVLNNDPFPTLDRRKRNRMRDFLAKRENLDYIEIFILLSLQNPGGSVSGETHSTNSERQSSTEFESDEVSSHESEGWQNVDQPEENNPTPRPVTTNMNTQASSHGFPTASQRQVVASREPSSMVSSFTQPEVITPEPGSTLHTQRLLLHQSDKFKGIHRICKMTEQQYRTEVWRHTNSTDFAHGLTQNRILWTHLKSGIFYLKIPGQPLGNNALLAHQELNIARSLIAEVVRAQPFCLLTDIHAVLSPAAISDQSLRFGILREFKQAADAVLGAYSPFALFCKAMLEEEGSDELSITALRVMLEESQRALPVDHPELFQLRRTLIRLYRRNRKYSEALRDSAELVEGSSGRAKRLAMTEWVYILKDKGDYEKAIEIAEEIVDSAKLELGPQFPDDKSIYAMEDLAELCQMLGRYKDTLLWLREAFEAAFNMWGNRPATKHIWDKLENLHELRYQRALNGLEVAE